MGAKLGGKGFVSDINMTPLIDIVLVVLIIMMVNIPIQVEQMGVKLPSEEPPVNPPPPNADQLVVALYEDGKVALNRTVYPEEAIFAQITQRLRSMTNKIVFVDAHPTVEYGRVIDYVDLAKEAGAEKVGFAKLKEAGPAAWTELGEHGLPRGVYRGSPGVAGMMTEKQADEQFTPLVPAVEACFATALGANPTLQGRVVIQVDVGPKGEILGTELVSSTVADEALPKCILEKVPSLRYEPLGDQQTARIHYPLVFSPG
jgi:biopolymer transport protein ExbD